MSFSIELAGDDLRKNNDNMVLGFERYRREKDKKLKLLITSNFSQQSKDRLKKLSNNIEFLGNVNSDYLDRLYANSLCVIFAPEYEGLGLPILEAVKKNKPIVCSDLNVFKEISSNSFYFVDQFSPESIAEGISSAVKNVEWEEKKTGYSVINKYYSWDNVIHRMLVAICEIGYKDKKPNKKRIAIFCPNPLGYSAIGRVVMRQHATISEFFDVDYYIEDDDQYSDLLNNVSFLEQVANVYKASTFSQNQYKDYSGVFYHIGNGYYHLEAIKNALYMPGITVIHDTNIEWAFKGLVDKKIITEKRLKAEEALNEFDTHQRTRFLTSITNAQTATIVHSNYAKDALNSIAQGVPVYKLELPVGSPNIVRNIEHKRLRVGIAGILHYTKGVSLLEYISSLKEFSNVDFYLFGFSMLTQNELDDLSSYPNIKLVTNLVEFEFQSLLEGLDILINYRTQYNGETSLTVLESMRFGVVPIVKNEGWYSELPNSSVVMVDEPDDLVDILKVLINNKELLLKISKNAIDYTRTQHTYMNYANAINKIISDISLPKRNNKINCLIQTYIKKNKLTISRLSKLIINYPSLSQGTNKKHGSFKREVIRYSYFLKKIDNKVTVLLGEKKTRRYDLSDNGLSKREVYNKVLADFKREQPSFIKQMAYRVYTDTRHLLVKTLKKLARQLNE